MNENESIDVVLMFPLKFIFREVFSFLNNNFRAIVDFTTFNQTLYIRTFVSFHNTGTSKGLIASENLSLSTKLV